MEGNNQDIARLSTGGERTSSGVQLSSADDKATAAGEGGVTDRVKSVASAVKGKADSLATGMQSSAEWLREADLEKLKHGVEKQVKEHPARSLLVALGAGFLIGKALRR